MKTFSSQGRFALYQHRCLHTQYISSRRYFNHIEVLLHYNSREQLSLNCITKSTSQTSLPNVQIPTKGLCSARNSVRSLLPQPATGDTSEHHIMFLNLLKHFCGLIKISLDSLQAKGQICIYPGPTLPRLGEIYHYGISGCSMGKQAGVLSFISSSRGLQLLFCLFLFVSFSF